MPLIAVKVKSGVAFSIYVLEESNKCELLGFFESLPAGEMSKIERYFNRTKDYGLIRDTEIFKPIGNGLFEFRTWRGVRIFCFLDAGKMVICTSGYIKKRDKLERSEIARAQIWKQKYEFAKSENSLRFEEGNL